jgi:protoporphyrin/coproporphyrin ferrochelatase
VGQASQIAGASPAASENKTAVVLFNLGGPDSPAAVEPFLFNLFNDSAIIRLPNPIRYVLAKMISKRRAPQTREIYHHIGGSSPLLIETKGQAEALEKGLEASGEFKCFVAMRYWHPFAAETAQGLKAYDPDRIILLPLYPQFSTTTTASSLDDWRRAARAAGLDVPTATICCYPDNDDFIAAHVEAIRREMEVMPADQPLRILFSAHGLPEKISSAGDPYKGQIEATVAAVMSELWGSDIDHQICYQSRVGPLKWIGPSTEGAIKKAAREGMNVMIVPISFVSEHSETLVELDIDYRKLASNAGIKHYHRVPALTTAPGFIRALKGLVLGALNADNGNDKDYICLTGGTHRCSESLTACPRRKG